MNDLSPVMAHFLGLAEQYLDYPLLITLESANGDGIKYGYKSKRVQHPTFEGWLGADTLLGLMALTGTFIPQFPLRVTITERLTGRAIVIQVPKPNHMLDDDWNCFITGLMG